MRSRSLVVKKSGLRATNPDNRAAMTRRRALLLALTAPAVAQAAGPDRQLVYWSPLPVFVGAPILLRTTASSGSAIWLDKKIEFRPAGAGSFSALAGVGLDREPGNYALVFNGQTIEVAGKSPLISFLRYQSGAEVRTAAQRGSGQNRSGERREARCVQILTSSAPLARCLCHAGQCALYLVIRHAPHLQRPYAEYSPGSRLCGRHGHRDQSRQLGPRRHRSRNVLRRRFHRNRSRRIHLHSVYAPLGVPRERGRGNREGSTHRQEWIERPRHRPSPALRRSLAGFLPGTLNSPTPLELSNSWTINGETTRWACNTEKSGMHRVMLRTPSNVKRLRSRSRMSPTGIRSGPIRSGPRQS